MTTKCVNPACNATLRYFRSGKIFSLETVDRHGESASPLYRRRENFWICGECLSAMHAERRGWSLSDFGLVLSASDPSHLRTRITEVLTAGPGNWRSRRQPDRRASHSNASSGP
jgi:hypothetical protein